MILQALNAYYDRASKDRTISEFGFGVEKVGFVVEIDSKGNLLQEHDIRTQEKNKTIPILMEIPFSNSVNVRSSNIQPNFLVDKASYVFGNDPKSPERAKDCFLAFMELLKDVAINSNSIALDTVIKFCLKWNPAEALHRLKYWNEMFSVNSGWIAFRIDGERELVHEKNEIKDAWKSYLKNKPTGQIGQCLISGHYPSVMQNLCAQFKGIAGGQSSGMSLISVNMQSGESYGKKDTFNIPVSIEAEFKSSTALKFLINSKSQHLYIGEAYTVFWTERESPMEGMFGMMLDPKDLDATDNADLRRNLEAVRDGKLLERIDPNVKFYILGLSPNAARLAVRFWHVCTVGQLEERIGQHFRDLKLDRSFDTDPEFPGIWRLLRETVNQKASDKSPQPLLAGAVMKAILEGTPYPQGLQNAVINRIRADQNINYVRVALLKAILNRKHRLFNQGMEVAMALDTENKNPAYLLGRLFSVLEKIQQEASPGINATIRDRFWGSASATPKVVFPQLLNLKHHHIAKMENPNRAMFFEKLIGTIVDDIESTGFSAHLSVDEQGLFAIGYYHQRQNFYVKTQKDNPQQ